MSALAIWLYLFGQYIPQQRKTESPPASTK